MNQAHRSRHSHTLTVGLALTLPLLLSSALALADGPCKEKREARHEARQALEKCLQSWVQFEKPGTPTPSSDCTSEVGAFTTAAKAVNQCHTEHEKKK